MYEVICHILVLVIVILRNYFGDLSNIAVCAFASTGITVKFEVHVTDPVYLSLTCEPTFQLLFIGQVRSTSEAS